MTTRCAIQRTRPALLGLVLFLASGAASSAQTNAVLTNRLERFHEHVYMRLNGAVNKVDTMFGSSEPLEGENTNSTFRLTLYTEVKTGSRNDFSISPDYEVDFRLPRLEKLLHIFVNNIAPDKMPGQNPLESQKSTYIGLQNPLHWADRIGLDNNVGIKVRFPPVLFFESKLKRKIDFAEYWRMTPQQSAFWFSDNGFGEKTSLTLDYLKYRKVVARTVSAARWTESTQGLEWSQVFQTGYILSGSVDDIDKTISSQETIAGHKSGSGTVDVYRWDLFWRAPIYKHWIYYIINPEITWERTMDWEPTRTLLVGVDMYFWGTSER